VSAASWSCGGEIGEERHDQVEQTLFCSSGNGTVILDGVRSPFVPGDAVVVTPRTRHNFLNTYNGDNTITAASEAGLSLGSARQPLSRYQP
jgi:mannose-6-phosphate isomerase-like protein (cupin superfamily)